MWRLLVVVACCGGLVCALPRTRQQAQPRSLQTANLGISVSYDTEQFAKEAQIARAMGMFISNLAEDVTPAQLQQMLEHNLISHEAIYGTCIAFEPDSYPVAQDGSPDVAPANLKNGVPSASNNDMWGGVSTPWTLPKTELWTNKEALLYAPYAWRGGDWKPGMPYHFMDLADGYNYWAPDTEWYHGPRTKFLSGNMNFSQGYWTEPYFDEGAGNIEMVTFSVPFWRKMTVPNTQHPDRDSSTISPYGIPDNDPVLDMHGVPHYFWGIATVDVVMAALSFDCGEYEIWDKQLLKCRPCDAGSYKRGMEECRLCEAGKAQSQPGQTACERCDVGGFAGEGAQTCTKCPGRLTTKFPGAVTEAECLCPEETVRDKDDRMLCSDCKDAMTCPQGSDMKEYWKAKGSDFDASTSSLLYPKLLVAYWSSADDPLNVYECANEARCPGGNPGSCADNAVNIACARCKDNHYGTAKECNPCADIETTQVMFPILPAILLPMIICGLYWFFRDMPDKWGSWMNAIAALVFLLLNHYQMISMAGTTNLDMPPLIADTWKVWSMSEDAVSMFKMDCAGYAGFQANFVIKSLGPVILLVFCGITFAGSHIVAKITAKGVAMDPSRLFNVFFSIIYAFFTGIATMSFSLFKCQTNPNGKRTLMRDLSVVCDEDEWNSMLGVAIVAVLVYCGGCLATCSYITLVAPRSFKDEGFQKRWKFLFIKYRLDVHWWGLVFLVKGVLLNIGPVLFMTAPAQLYWMMLTGVGYLSLMFIFFPWRLHVATVLDGLIHMSIIIVLSLLTWFSDKDIDLDADLTEFTVAMSCMPFLAFVVVVAYVMIPVIQHKTDPSARDTQLDATAKAIRESMRAIGTLDDKDIRSLYESLSQHDQHMLVESSNCIKVEMLGSMSFKLTTHSSTSLGDKAKAALGAGGGAGGSHKGENGATMAV